jgi:hypothetical protein
MKTTMQEMIDWIEERFNNPKETEVFKKATELLEKEKEQIKNDFTNGKLFPSLKFEEYYTNEYQKNK